MYFAKKAQNDGTDCHAINKILSDANDTVDSSERMIVDDTLIVGTITFELKEFIKLRVSTIEERAMRRIIEQCLAYDCSPEMISWFISCIEGRGVSSEAIFLNTFESYLAGLSSRRDITMNAKRILDRVRVIASTGYKLPRIFVVTCFPDHYSELMNAGPLVGGERKRVRKEDFYTET
ncbi:hypothetical protein RRF57_003728 [Xylaria bambusicola]|uniref:Uncharacterized protein n=1 Tax=Xylaria bambusicola TaxID=326684 RepID=A0AAN7Z5N0_9PEZI